MVKILHLSDLHIGKVYNNYPTNVKEALQEARFETLEKLISYGNDRQADLLVLAGDIFDRLNVNTSTIEKTCSILRAFTGVILTLAGNHDFYSGNEELWDRYQENLLDSHIFLNEFRPYDLQEYGIDTVIYPAFCTSKHSKENNLSWIKEAKVDESRLNIGISHGALEGLSADLEGNYFKMTRQELRAIPMDLWLLGHTHVPYPVSGKSSEERIFNAGTHEPDGMNYPYEGSAFYIEIDKDKIDSERVISGKFSFDDREEKIASSLAETLGQFSQGYENTLLRLRLVGFIDEEEYKTRHEIYKDLRDKVFYLDIRDEDLKIKLSAEKISEKFIHGSFPEKMLLKLQNNEDLLQTAYNLIEESRKA